MDILGRVIQIYKNFICRDASAVLRDGEWCLIFLVYGSTEHRHDRDSHQQATNVSDDVGHGVGQDPPVQQSAEE